MPFHIVENDLVQMDTEAIVNAANSSLQGGSGACGAIFSAAGWEEMQAACDALAPCPVGGAVSTPGFGLRQKYVIHAVGPIWKDGAHGEKELLRSAYRSALGEAERLGLSSVAFPLISSGNFGYPKAEALSVAMDTAREFLMEKDEREMEIYLVVLDRSAVAISKKLFGEIDRYLKETQSGISAAECSGRRRGYRRQEYEAVEKQRLEQEQAFERRRGTAALAEESAMPVQVGNALPKDIDALLRSMRRESFAERLFRFIDDKKLSDPQVYKAANLDRKLFSKIRSRGADYKPTKNTALALAIGAGLDYDETQELLGTAGFTLSDSSVSDAIVGYFLKSGNDDIFEIEAALCEYGQPSLSSPR